MAAMMNKQVKPSPSVRCAEFESRVDIVAGVFNCSEDEAFKSILDRLQKMNCIKHCAGIVHNQDVDDVTGKMIAPHMHIVIELRYPVTLRNIAGQLGMPEQTVNKIKQKKMQGKKWVSDIGGALSYLTHRNAPEKHQYSDDEVVASNGWEWKTIRATSEKFQATSDLEKILSGIVNGEIKQSNLADAIDPHIYIAYRKQIDSAFDYRRKMLLATHERQLMVIYIQGEKGTGKTSLAKQFAEEKGLTYFVSGGSNDPFDGYGGEAVVILDDARPDWFAPEEWLKILDNYTNSLIHSRYHNKINEASYIIITSVLPIESFFENFYTEDPIVNALTE